MTSDKEVKIQYLYDSERYNCVKKSDKLFLQSPISSKSARNVMTRCTQFFM